ncbi:dephospho-CoA kinase [Nakamurella endophytica]|uniref:Dephospho-CoA kinase n=1 Tax=Nakamurella endophytica TaxID=1748367 RepID=A0A917SQ01_9ACTN|nr:dephospho-CoA kinase [Nakamurella endophytica]GGL91006.1 dephospho-CoA kinase [Nakamurella endophytica]
MALTVAVTGGIGAGKSTVSRMLAELGATVVDSDRLARDVVAPGTPGLAEIVRTFGPGVVGADGALDRAALAAVVFADPEARRRLEAITHPRVRAAFDAVVREAGREAVVVNDIPLLRDVAAAAAFHLVIGVHAPDEVRVRRLVGRGLAESDARARLAAQIDDRARARLCDLWWSNDGSPEALRPLVADTWRGRILPFRDAVLAGDPAQRGGPVLVPADPGWPEAAARLAARVSRATGGGRVDHIGSTAVPGMPAKDVVDLQLAVDDLAQADQWSDALRDAGFPRVPGRWRDTPHPPADEPALWDKRLHANADPGRTVNLHVRVRDSPGWRWALLFPAWLRADPEAAAEYLAVKRWAAVDHAADRTAAGYAEAKEPWMAEAYRRGLAWARRTGWHPAG